MGHLTRRYSLVYAFCFFKLFLMVGKGLKQPPESTGPKVTGIVMFHCNLVPLQTPCSRGSTTASTPTRVRKLPSLPSSLTSILTSVTYNLLIEGLRSIVGNPKSNTGNSLK